MFEVISGRRPNRPKQTKLPGLKDEVWNLIEDCWKADPTQRPEMSAVLPIVEEFLIKSPPPPEYPKELTVDPMATRNLVEEELQHSDTDEDDSDTD